MPMVDASTQVTPPPTPAPPRRNAKAGPSKAPAPAVNEKEPVRAAKPQATTVPPAPSRVQIIQPPRTPCVAQPVALLAFVAGVGLGVTIGLACAGLVPPITGYAAAVLSVMLLLFVAGAPPFHATYPGPARNRS